MAERPHHHTEHHERAPVHETHVEAPRHHEHERHHEKPEHEKLPSKHELERQVIRKAKGRHETPINELQKSSQEPILGLQRDLKANAYRQTLRKVRSHLSPAERTFSKFIHQPVVESVSEISGKTVARPSGLLGGGIVSLLISGGLLYMTKHYGFRYNFFVFILAFAIGFAVGVVLELLFRGRSQLRRS